MRPACLQARAARLAAPDAVKRILELFPGAAKVKTYPSRNPGSWTPLHCLGDAEHSNMNQSDVNKTAELLVEAMDAEWLGLQTSKGQTVFHLAASRGNHAFLTHALRIAWEKLGFKTISNILNTPNEMGRSVKDVSMYSNSCREVVVRYGGKNTAD